MVYFSQTVRYSWTACYHRIALALQCGILVSWILLASRFIYASTSLAFRCLTQVLFFDLALRFDLTRSLALFRYILHV